MNLTGEELHQMYVEERAARELHSIPWSCLGATSQGAWNALAERMNERMDNATKE